LSFLKQLNTFFPGLVFQGNSDFFASVTSRKTQF